MESFLSLFSFGKWNWVSVVLGIILMIYAYGAWRVNYFKRKGIKNESFIPFFGNMFKVFIQREHFMDVVHRLYKLYPGERYVGLMQVNQPLIMVKDLKLLKQIAVKDFDHFLNHQSPISEEVDPLFGSNLFALKGDKWRDMRATLSPAFTSSKMRTMFEFVVEIGQQMTDFYIEKMKDPQWRERGLVEVEMKDAFTRYTNDVIATSAFGIKVNSLHERDNEFYKIGKKSTDFSGFTLFKVFLYQAVPSLMKLFKITLFTEDVKQFYRSLVLDTMKRRENNGIVRHDMINILMETKKGSLKYESSLADVNDAGFATVEESHVGRQTVKRRWKDDDLVAQAILFFIAGFETASTLLCFMAHELMINPQIQQTLQDEIDELVAKKGDKVEYNDLNQMTYMDMVVTETLRKWPPAVAIDRECSKAYKLPPSNDSTKKEILIQPGELLWIPIIAIHHDPEYYPNPEKFDPERFSEANKGNIDPLSFLPFGLGPRNCIGSRFALMEAKAVMFSLLSKFSFVEIGKTQNPIKIAKNNFNMHAERGFWIGLKPRF